MTAPAGSEDAGLVLSAEEHNDHGTNAGHFGWDRWVYPEDAVVRIVAARVEAARVEERERIAAAIDEAPGFRRWIDDSRVVDKDVAIRIARTPPPAGDAQGSQEARNGPMSAEQAGDGRGHGRDDESGRGAGL